MWLVIISLLWIFSTGHLVVADHTKETFFNPLLGIPWFFFGSWTRLKLPYNALAGSLSYGLFLAHFLVIWILDYLGTSSVTSPALLVLAVFLGSLANAWLGGVYLETRGRPVEKKCPIIYNFCW